MAEPTNPLFEEEKAFLERKKLEYERALRGDVEHIKDQTLNVGKVALVGAGLAGGVWLIARALRGRQPDLAKATRKAKRKLKKGQHGAGHDYFADKYAADDYQFGRGLTEDDEEDVFGYAAQHDQPARHGDDELWGHYQSTEAANDYAHADRADRHAAAFADDFADEDDNGLADYPDFPAHSERGHGYDDEASRYDEADQAEDDRYAATAGYDDEQGENGRAAAAPERRFYHPEHSHPTANRLPYDDARRLPASDAFRDEAKPAALAGGPTLTRRLVEFAQSETGRNLLGQAAAAGLALFGKVMKDRLPNEAGTAAETLKTSDLAAPSTPAPAAAAVPTPAADAAHPDSAPTPAPSADARP